MSKEIPEIVWFEAVGRDDVPLVGGKNASLGEMIVSLAREGIRVPPGFATTADAYRHFIRANQLAITVSTALAELSTGKAQLAEVGQSSRRAFLRA